MLDPVSAFLSEEAEYPPVEYQGHAEGYDKRDSYGDDRLPVNHVAPVYGAAAQLGSSIFSLYPILWRLGRDKAVAGEAAPGWDIRGSAGVLSNEEQDVAGLHGLETQAEFQHQLAAGHVSGIPGVVGGGRWVCCRSCHVGLKLWRGSGPDAGGLFNGLAFLPARPVPTAAVAGLATDITVSVSQEICG